MQNAGGGTLALTDCHLRSVVGHFYSYYSFGPAFNFTNNLAFRSKLAFFQNGSLGFLPLTVNLYNNTFSGGQVNPTYDDGQGHPSSGIISNSGQP